MHIVSIVYKPREVDTRPIDHFSRVAVESAQLVADYGIEGDVKGGHPTRQLNIMCARKLEKLRAQGYAVEPGMMGEQLMITGVDLSALVEGDRLQLGATAVVEMTARRSGCLRFETVQGQPNPTLEQPVALGIMAKVVAGGQIRVGDAVVVLTPNVA